MGNMSFKTEDELRRLLSELSGSYGRGCYDLVVEAVALLLERYPQKLSAQEVACEVARRMGKKKANTVAVGLSRAVADMWERKGGRGWELLCGERPPAKPAPQTVLLMLRDHLVRWERGQRQAQRRLAAPGEHHGPRRQRHH